MPITKCIPILKALTDQSRMRIVKALLVKPHDVTELAKTLAISQYNVSKYLRTLRAAGIVDVAPRGTHREYFIVPALRKGLKDQTYNVLDFGCCRFRFDQLST